MRPRVDRLVDDGADCRSHVQSCAVMATGDQIYGVGCELFPQRVARLFETVESALMAPPPKTLYVRGEWSREHASVVGIVGSRAAACHAMAFTSQLAADLARGGVTIVSGGAIGIDSAAHRGAIAVGGYTVAVVAGGLDATPAARCALLYSEILDQGGALLSSEPGDTPAQRYRYIQRNRLLASLCDVIVVAAAQPGSGALSTAAFAAKMGRQVAAVPGTPGTEMLIAQGAAVVESGADVHAALEGAPRVRAVNAPEPGSAESRVLGALDDVTPAGEDAIARSTGLSAREVKRALTELSLDGLALPLAGRAFVRSALGRAAVLHSVS